MRDIIKNILREELTRSDKEEVKKIARLEFQKMVKQSDIKTQIEDIVKKQLKSDKPTQRPKSRSWYAYQINTYA